MTGEAVPMLLDLVDRGIIRVLDVLFVIKDEDGTFSGFEATDLDSKGVGRLRRLRGRLLRAARRRGRGHGRRGHRARVRAAVLLVYENRWAGPFAAAVRRNGGVLVDFQRIPVAGPDRRPRRRRSGGLTGRTHPCQDCFAEWPAPPSSPAPPPPSRTASAAARRTAGPRRSRRQQQYAAPPPPPAAAPGRRAGPVEQLKELAALKDQGILTEEEFAAQKAKLLAA